MVPMFDSPLCQACREPFPSLPEGVLGLVKCGSRSLAPRRNWQRWVDGPFPECASAPLVSEPDASDTGPSQVTSHKSPRNRSQAAGWRWQWGEGLGASPTIPPIWAGGKPLVGLSVFNPNCPKLSSNAFLAGAVT